MALPGAPELVRIFDPIGVRRASNMGRQAESMLWPRKAGERPVEIQGDVEWRSLDSFGGALPFSGGQLGFGLGSAGSQYARSLATGSFR